MKEENQALEQQPQHQQQHQYSQQLQHQQQHQYSQQSLMESSQQQQLQYQQQQQQNIQQNQALTQKNQALAQQPQHQQQHQYSQQSLMASSQQQQLQYLQQQQQNIQQLLQEQRKQQAFAQQPQVQLQQHEARKRRKPISATEIGTSKNPVGHFYPSPLLRSSIGTPSLMTPGVGLPLAGDSRRYLFDVDTGLSLARDSGYPVDPHLSSTGTPSFKLSLGPSSTATSGDGLPSARDLPKGSGT